MNRRPFLLTGRFAALALAFAALTLPSSARAADGLTPAACVAANEQADSLRRAGKLRESRAQLRLCAGQTCPSAVRKDCIAGAIQADADMPTIAFSAQDPAGNDLSAVLVTMDGQPFAEKLDGKAIDLDPGEHVFRFVAGTEPPVEKRLVIVEAEKNRRERIVIGQPKAVVAVIPMVAPVVVPPPRRSSRRTVGLIVGGAGLGVLAGGGAAGIVAAVEWSAAKKACGGTFPLTCVDRSAANSDRNATLAASTVADIALAVGGAAVVVGAALVLTAPEGSSSSTTQGALTLAPQITPQFAGLALGGTF